MLKRAFLATALCGWTALAAAETAYVTDSLRLGLHAASDTSGRPFENLVSGAAVEVLERNTNYARVRLADGREGWVKAMYLVTVKPAAARVAELEAEIATLREAAAAAQDGADGRGARARAVQCGATRDRRDRPRPSRTPCSACKRENEAHEERLETYRHTLPLKWVIPARRRSASGWFSGRPVVARRPDTPSPRRLSRLLVGA